MSARLRVPLLALAVLALATAAEAQQAYRWLDEAGNVHYTGRRDQVPEQYRHQLPAEGPSEPPKPVLPLPATRSVGGPVTGECFLRFRGTERRRGSTQSFPSCDACWKALAAMKGEDASRAECLPTSVESYR